MKRSDLTTEDLYAVRHRTAPGMHDRPSDVFYDESMGRFLSVKRMWTFGETGASVRDLRPAPVGARAQGGTGHGHGGTGLLYISLPAVSATPGSKEAAAELLRMQLPDLDGLDDEAAAQALQVWREKTLTSTGETLGLKVSSPVQVLSTWDEHAAASYTRQAEFHAEYGRRALEPFVAPVAAARAALAAGTTPTPPQAQEAAQEPEQAASNVDRARVLLLLAQADALRADLQALHADPTAGDHRITSALEGASAAVKALTDLSADPE